MLLLRGAHRCDADAFDLPMMTKKIARIEGAREVHHGTLGLDLTDDSLSAPQTGGKDVCKGSVQWIESKNRPVTKLFENKYNFTIKCLWKRRSPSIPTASTISFPSTDGHM